MAKKRSYVSQIPLEWRTQTIAISDTTSVAATTAEIDLDLQDDELAEIHHIDACIDAGGLGEADNEYAAGLLLSLDPDASSSPLALASLTDIETFFNMRFSMNNYITTSGSNAMKTTENKAWDCCHYPIMVGTNIGIVFEAESTVDVPTDVIVTVYFKRRKATAVELANILLKRR